VTVETPHAADQANAGHRFASVAFCVLACVATGTSCRTRDDTHRSDVEAAARAAARADHQEWLKNTELESALVRPVQTCETRTPEGLGGRSKPATDGHLKTGHHG
jgi:hypothetical protein